MKSVFYARPVSKAALKTPIERNGSAKADEAAGVWVFAERADALLPVALELTGRARQLADKRGAYVTALLPCGTREDADALIAAGADRIISCPSTHLQTRARQRAETRNSAVRRDRLRALAGAARSGTAGRGADRRLHGA